MIGCGCEIAPTPAVLQGLTVRPGAATLVPVAGTSVVAIYGGVVGGLITNPATTADQGIAPLVTAPVTVSRLVGPLDTFAFNGGLPIDGDVTDTVVVQEAAYGPAEVLYVSLLGPAATTETAGTVALAPGQSFPLPPGCANDVWVNATTSGHRFSAVVVQPVTQHPPVPYAGAFPPAGPTGKTTTIPSYLYQQFKDDDDLQALVASHNALMQTYVDWFNQLELPVYTKLSGALLDWVGRGLYGLARPTLYSGLISDVGPYATAPFNSLAINDYEVVDEVTDIAVTSDDVYKRIITWHFFKGDGKHVTPQWLKRRVLRFLYGTNGTDYQGSAYQVSVVAAGGNLSVTIVTGTRKVTAGAFDTLAFNDGPLNDTRTTMIDTYAAPALSGMFQEALLTGALEMPVQYAATCRVGVLGVR